MTVAQDRCNHQWLLNIGRSADCSVACKLCWAQFKPEVQQIPYGGIIPKKWKKNYAY